MLFVQVQEFGTGNKYDLEIFHDHWKRVKNKRQKDFEANYYVCRSYRGKTAWGDFLFPQS